MPGTSVMRLVEVVQPRFHDDMNMTIAAAAAQVNLQQSVFQDVAAAGYGSASRWISVHSAAR
jgi:hypothetical protein